MLGKRCLSQPLSPPEIRPSDFHLFWAPMLERDECICVRCTFVGSGYENSYGSRTRVTFHGDHEGALCWWLSLSWQLEVRWERIAALVWLWFCGRTASEWEIVLWIFGAVTVTSCRVDFFLYSFSFYKFYRFDRCGSNWIVINNIRKEHILLALENIEFSLQML